jgi:putative ABC transport system substrate-binding protein
MRRRDLFTLLGGATAWTFAAHAQPSAMPAIGFLHSGTRAPAHAGFGRGLREIGLIEGQSVTVEYRYAQGHYDRLPAMAAELVQRPVAVLVAAGGAHTPVAAKRATTTTPIVFAIGSDPVRFGLVTSLNRPEGNLTGVSFFAAELEAKRLGLLKGVAPQASAICVLINPNNANADDQAKQLREAAGKLGVQLHILHARDSAEIDAAFANALLQRGGALVVASDPFFFAQRQQLVGLTARQSVAAIYEWREFVQAGGLMSYGTNLAESYRQAGLYAGRILKGEKPKDLPVVLSTKFEFVINLKAAKALGLTVPDTMQLLADEVID